MTVRPRILYHQAILHVVEGEAAQESIWQCVLSTSYLLATLGIFCHFMLVK